MPRFPKGEAHNRAGMHMSDLIVVMRERMLHKLLVMPVY